MNFDAELVVIVGTILLVNAGAILLLAALSYAWSAFALNALAAVDRWLDPSRKA